MLVLRGRFSKGLIRAFFRIEDAEVVDVRYAFRERSGSNWGEIDEQKSGE
jgi:hypothetical protein